MAVNRHRPLSIGGDRNARVLREHHHKQFVERVTTGLVQPQDRYAKPLSVGDLVQWQPAFQPVAQIVEINVMPLGAQPPEGSCRVEVVLSLSAPVALDVTQPAPILVRVKEADIAAEEQPEAPPADSPLAPEDPDAAPDAPSS